MGVVALHRSCIVVAFGAVAALALAPAARAAPRVPAGFVVESVSAANDLLENPTGLAVLPDGSLLVTEQRGVVWRLDHGVRQAATVWSAENEVLFDQESGLVGLAVDPNYVQNHYLYFFYTVDPDSDGVDDNLGAFGRLTRYQVRFDGSNTVDPASRTILMGTRWADAPITGINTHTVGSLRWGRDGTLLVSHGDGDDWTQTDAGGLYPQIFGPGLADPIDDIGAFRAQSLSSLNGKILRIDPATGLGLPSNPFFDGNPASPRSKVYAYGLRNPYRFTVRPGTGDPDPAHGNPGVLYIGDVGWFNWEELDVADQPGLNFGWPCREGLLPVLEYSAAAPFRLGCDSVGVSTDDPRPVAPPTSVWNHGVAGAGVPPGFTGGASVGGVFYQGSLYPAKYRGRYFHADYGAAGGWIRAATMTPDDRLIQFDSFGTSMDAPVAFEIEPGTGNLLYVSYFTGQVRRIRWTGAPEGNAPPVAFGRGEPTLGVAPLEVDFFADGSWDPDGDAITCRWQFGDGTPDDPTPNPVHTYATAGSRLARLTVTDAFGATDTDTFTVNVTAAPAIPTVAVLDDFNRADGTLEAPWMVDGGGLEIAGDALEHATGDTRALWGTTFPGVQEAWMTIGPDAFQASRVALLLKAQGLGADDARVEVSWDPQAGEVLVTTDDLSFRKISRGAPIPADFEPGDRFGARALADGRIEVFRGGARLGVRSIAGWPAAGAPGRIGLWIETPAPALRPIGRPPVAPAAGATSLTFRRRQRRPIAPQLDGQPVGGALLDDFGGGEVFIPGNRPPVVLVASPPDSSFFDGLAPVALSGSAVDPEDPADSLDLRWTVTRRHTNRSDVPLKFSGPSASFTPIDPRSEAGTWYDIQLVATDTRGAADTSKILIFPESDLVPVRPETNAGHLAPGTPSQLEFWIRNDGPLISTRSFWRVLLDGTSIGMNMMTIPGRDSVKLVLALPGLATGNHLVRIVADTLRQAVETDEANNVVLVPIAVGLENVGVEGAAPRALALSAPVPNPTQGRVSLTLDLPAASPVEYEIDDLLGRRVYAEPARVRDAGRWVLRWDGRQAGGPAAPPGVYLARVRVGGSTLIRRVALIR